MRDFGISFICLLLVGNSKEVWQIVVVMIAWFFFVVGLPILSDFLYQRRRRQYEKLNEEFRKHYKYHEKFYREYARQMNEATKQNSVEHYKNVLGVVSLTRRDVRSAFRRQALIHHPDRGGNAAQFRKAKEAYDVLMQIAR